MPAASSHWVRARTRAELGLTVGQGHDRRGRLGSLAAGAASAGSRDRCALGPPVRMPASSERRSAPGEPDQQQRAVAQPRADRREWGPAARAGRPGVAARFLIRIGRIAVGCQQAFRRHGRRRFGEGSPAARCRKRIAARLRSNVLAANPRSRSSARKAATSGADAGSGTRSCVSHQAHQARTADR